MKSKSTNIETMGQIAEHSLYKAFAPVVTTLLLGCVGWLFVTLIDVQTNLKILTDAKIPIIQEQLDDIIIDYEENIEDLESDLDQLYELVTILRIQLSQTKASIEWPLP
jgi:hypothetical protein